MRFLTTLLGLFLIHSISFSQVKINGLIKDDAGTPIPNATIEWQASFNSSKTIHADKEGLFSIPLLKSEEKYLFQVSATGYKEQVVSFTLLNDTIIHFILPRNSTVLEGVTVKSNARFIQIKPDKTIINIGDNPILAGNNMAEALGKIPGLQISNELISIPGKGSVQLMLDGRLLPLSQKELLNYLKSFPVANISKIEIITSPSAVYDAGGNAGLINIITKRNTQKGYSGSIEAGYMNWQKYPGAELSTNANYNTGRWNIFANANYYKIRRKFGFRWEEYYKDRTWIMSDTGNYFIGILA